MATFQQREHVRETYHPDFNQELQPNMQARHGGIYQCLVCRTEVVVSQFQFLPPNTHHVHVGTDKPIVWRLLVAANVTQY